MHAFVLLSRVHTVKSSHDPSGNPYMCASSVGVKSGICCSANITCASAAAVALPLPCVSTAESLQRYLLHTQCGRPVGNRDSATLKLLCIMYNTRYMYHAPRQQYSCRQDTMMSCCRQWPDVTCNVQISSSQPESKRLRVT